MDKQTVDKLFSHRLIRICLPGHIQPVIFVPVYAEIQTLLLSLPP